MMSTIHVKDDEIGEFFSTQFGWVKKHMGGAREDACMCQGFLLHYQEGCAILGTLPREERRKLNENRKS